MKLPIDDNHLEVGGNVTKTRCTIGDENLILSYLRSKIYTNRPRVIVQEISCNARDANIENGCGDVPIRIKTPTIFDPFWECSDDGAGMSPKVIDEVYRRVGISTKRGNNESLGKFGLGSKSPLSLVTNFTISTCAYEGDVKVRREYHCALGENRDITILQFEDSAEITDDPTGTKITVPLEAKDFQAFCEYSKDVTKFWKVPPVINGEQYNPVLPEYLYEHDGFCITKNSLGYSNGVILGEIFYPIDLTTLKFSNILTQKFSNRILLKFEGSELNVNVGRETLDYDDSTRQTIIKRLNEALEVVQKDAIESVQNATSLWNAHSEHSKNSTILGNKPIDWRGHIIRGSRIDLPKDTVGRIYTNGYKSSALTSYSNVYAFENSMLCHRDVGSASVKRVETLYDKYKVNTVYVVDNPEGVLVEICAGFPKLSEVSYQRQSYSVKVHRLYKHSKYNRYRSTYEDLIGKEQVLVDDLSIDDFSCWIPYDKLYEVDRELLWDVLKKNQVAAVPLKAVKYFEGELPTFEDYVREQAQKIPDKIVKLRAINEQINKDYSTIGINVSGNIFGIYEKTLKALSDNKVDLDKYPGSRYSKFINDERAKPAIDFIHKLEEIIEKDFPIIEECGFKYLSHKSRTQLCDFLNYMTQQNPKTYEELSQQFKELELS